MDWWLSTMSNQWIAPESCPSLAVLVETVTAPLLIQHSAPICLEMDVDGSLEIPADPSQTAELIRSLVGQLLGEMTAGGDLTITAHQSTGRVVLELADSGCQVGSRPRNTPMAAAAIGATLDWQDGSQGGAVVKITFARNGQSDRLAA